MGHARQPQAHPHRPKAGLYYDNEAGAGGTLLALIQDRLECDEVEAIAWVKQQGVDVASKHPIASYSYRAVDGTMLFRVLRWAPKKSFTQEHWDSARRSSGPG